MAMDGIAGSISAVSESNFSVAKKGRGSYVAFNSAVTPGTLGRLQPIMASGWALPAGYEVDMEGSGCKLPAEMGTVIVSAPGITAYKAKAMFYCVRKPT